MGLIEAKKYIDALHKKQDNPYLWPDFLTGLPDKTAILKKISEVYGLKNHCVFYVRIANVHPYLIKYGPDRHADIIQWAAALLKTSAEKRGGFVGAFSSHDFVAVCPQKKAADFIAEAAGLFAKKASSFYSKDDLKKGKVISFMGEDKKITVGLMRLISSSVRGDEGVPKDRILQHLGGLMEKMEKEL